MITITNILGFLKKINPIVSPILVGVLAFVCINLLIGNKQLEKDKLVSSKRATTATKIIERYLDKNGSEHLVIEDETITKEQKKQLDKNSGLIDTVATALNIAREKIKELQVINATLVIANAKGKVEQPGNPLSIIRYVDKYADINYNPADTTFGLKYNIDLRDVKHTKNSGFLGLRSTNVIDLYSPDKRVTINGVERYSIEIPEPDFGLRGQVKAQYNIGTKSFTPAATLEANYKSWTVEGNLFYNTKTNKVTPTVGIKKDLFHWK